VYCMAAYPVFQIISKNTNVNNYVKDGKSITMNITTMFMNLFERLGYQVYTYTLSFDSIQVIVAPTSSGETVSANYYYDCRSLDEIQNDDFAQEKEFLNLGTP